MEEDYTKHRKSYCEDCGVKQFGIAGDYRFKRKTLTVHHMDNNHSNNDPRNLQTLCRKCHDKKHKK